MLKKTATSLLETEFGSFEIQVFRDEIDGKEHVALLKEWGDQVPVVRIHSKCATGDIFGSVYCDCRLQLHAGLKKISEEGGVLIYLEQEGRGLGLTHKIKAYELQRAGMDTVEADEHMGEGIDDRTYELAAQMLRSLGIEKLKLLTNNPAKLQGLLDEGFDVEREEHIVQALSERGEKYQQAKREKLGHMGEGKET